MVLLRRQHSHPSKVEGGQDNSWGLVRTGNGYTGVSVLHLRILQGSVSSIFPLHIDDMGKTQDLYNILRPNAIIGFMHWIWHSDLVSTYLKYAFHFTIMLDWDPKGAILAGLAVSRSRVTSSSNSIVFVYTTSILNLKQPIKGWSRTTSAWVIFL